MYLSLDYVGSLLLLCKRLLIFRFQDKIYHSRVYCIVDRIMIPGELLSIHTGLNKNLIFMTILKKIKRSYEKSLYNDNSRKVMYDDDRG